METVLVSSGLVFIFLGFCALIVVAQVMPAIMTMTGMIKGLATDHKTVEVK
jgi:hypothetical protein